MCQVFSQQSTLLTLLFVVPCPAASCWRLVVVLRRTPSVWYELYIYIYRTHVFVICSLNFFFDSSCLPSKMFAFFPPAACTFCHCLRELAYARSAFSSYPAALFSIICDCILYCSLSHTWQAHH